MDLNDPTVVAEKALRRAFHTSGTPWTGHGTQASDCYACKAAAEAAVSALAGSGWIREE